MKIPPFIKKDADGKLTEKKLSGELYFHEGIYLPIALDDHRIIRFITEIQKVWSNGGACIRCVEATTPLVYESLEYSDHLLEFFKSPSLRNCISELKIPDDVLFPQEPINIGRHQFEGKLTDILFGGGAYGKFRGDSDEARRITRECVDALGHFLWNSSTGFGAISISGGWTPAFYGVAWDETFILHSSDRRKWVLMWMTDTD